MSHVYHAQSGSLIVLPLVGASEKNLSITVEENILRVSANREKSNRAYLLKERMESTDHTFKLRANTDLDLIDAKLTNGLLTIHIPRKTTHRDIKIQAA